MRNVLIHIDRRNRINFNVKISLMNDCRLAYFVIRRQLNLEKGQVKLIIHKSQRTDQIKSVVLCVGAKWSIFIADRISKN